LTGGGKVIHEVQKEFVGGGQKWGGALEVIKVRDSLACLQTSLGGPILRDGLQKEEGDENENPGADSGGHLATDKNQYHTSKDWLRRGIIQNHQKKGETPKGIGGFVVI